MLVWILFIIALLCVAPALAFLCAKWGIVGYMRGKEVSAKIEDEIDSVQNNDDTKL